MRVLLISSNTERITMVTIPLGLGMVAAASRTAGHEVSFLDLLDEDDLGTAIRRAVAAGRPEVIGISVRNIDDQSRESPRFLLERVKPVVAACRACTDAPVVLGGAGYSIFPDAALAYLGADFGVCGDGEAVFPALLERLRDGRDPSDLPGVHTAGRPTWNEPCFEESLDALPLWDGALDDIADPASPELWVPVQSRRGCPNDCAYCSTASIQGRRIRLHAPRQVVERVAKLAGAGFQRFYFVDNSFNIPVSQAFAICHWMRELAPGVTWRCILYPHLIGETLVRALAEAGCVEVSLGFESGSAAVLRELNKRFTPADVRAAADLLRAHGIRRMGFLLLGGPGETRETVEESLAFAESLGLDSLRVTVGIRIYPGTPLARRAVQDGVISAGDDLLRPRFYLAPGLEPWIHERVAHLTQRS
ncbi:MAG: B12-binding domain-containing radical SAM protein [Acidobacteriota bacterium]